MTDRGLATQLRLMLMRGTYGSDRQISDVFGFLKNGSDRLHQRCVWIHKCSRPAFSSCLLGLQGRATVRASINITRNLEQLEISQKSRALVPG